jgi:uncharacterized membrane protein (DUF373 family)
MLERITRQFEAVVISIVQVLLMIVITILVLTLIWLFWVGVTQRIGDIHDVAGLQTAAQNAFAGVLLVLLGLEIMQSLETYFVDQRARVELILIIAIIAVGRHIIQLDFEHLDGLQLIGIGTLMLALAGGFFLLRRSVPRKP